MVVVVVVVVAAGVVGGGIVVVVGVGGAALAGELCADFFALDDIGAVPGGWYIDSRLVGLDGVAVAAAVRFCSQARKQSQSLSSHRIP